jgi:hypothetical protein
MKKILLACGLMMAGTALVCAQGTIKFNNTSASFLVSTNDTINGGTIGLTDKVAGDYYYALLYDVTTPTSADPASGGWTATGLIGTNGTIFAGGITGPGGANGTAVSEVAPGATAFFEVVGWSASLNGMTLAQMFAANDAGPTSVLWAANGYYGVSSPTATALTLGGEGTPASLPPSLFSSPSAIPSGFVLNVIGTPEPAPIALAGLGGMVLLALRRRK